MALSIATPIHQPGSARSSAQVRRRPVSASLGSMSEVRSATLATSGT